MGGTSEVAFRRAARKGDGFTFAAAGQKTIAQVERVRDLLGPRAVIRRRSPRAHGHVRPGEERWTRAAEGARQAGIDYLSVNTMSTTAAWTGMQPPGFTTCAEHIAALERFKAVVG